jgi:cytochrome c551/c552
MKKQVNQPNTVQWALFLVVGLFCIPATIAILMMKLVTAEMLLVVPPTPIVPTATPYPEEVILMLPTGNSLRGSSLFESEGCRACHSLDGTNRVGPPLNDVSMSTPNDYDSVEDYLISSILRPGEYVVAGYTNVMPPLYAEQLTSQELADLIAFLIEQ